MSIVTWYMHLHKSCGDFTSPVLTLLPLFRCVYTCIGWARPIYIYGVYTVFLAGNSPNIRSYTVYIYSFGQPCTCTCTGTLANSWQPALRFPALTATPASSASPVPRLSCLMRAEGPALLQVGSPLTMAFV